MDLTAATLTRPFTSDASSDTRRRIREQEE
jgi:hypothetical protein